MKKLLLLYIVLASFVSEAQPIANKQMAFQTDFLVTYRYVWHEDTLNIEKALEEDMMLQIAGDKSLFQSVRKYKGDAFIKKAKADKSLANGSIVPKEIVDNATQFLFLILKDFSTDSISVLNHIIMTGKFFYAEPFSAFNWQIHPDTSNIGGHKVQKASAEFGGRQWVAWFAVELPFNDGPYMFCGLPGLILKVCDTRNQHCFEFVSIEKPADMLMEFSIVEEATHTTRRRFHKMSDDARQNIMQYAKEAMATEEMQRIAYEKMRHRNNPIEIDWR